MFSRADETSQSIKPQKRSEIIDQEFGSIAYRRSPQARFVRLRITEDGAIRASLPKRAPLYLIRELVDSSRQEIRRLINEQQAKRVRYENGMNIGHSHRLFIEYGDVPTPRKKLTGQTLTVTLPINYREQAASAQAFISSQVKAVLKREAKAYLPRRLRYLADRFGFGYERERFGNQRGRWGSCSSTGTISLNVALMNLPHEVIDYVLIHELAHTRQMNHSPNFWQIVESCMPDYKQQRKILKTMSPIC